MRLSHVVPTSNVLTYNGFLRKIKHFNIDQWTLSFQRRDKDWCRTINFGDTEGARAEIDGLARSDLFGADNEAHVLVHLFREGDSRCPVLLDALLTQGDEAAPEDDAALSFKHFLSASIASKTVDS